MNSVREQEGNTTEDGERQERAEKRQERRKKEQKRQKKRICMAMAIARVLDAILFFLLKSEKEKAK